MDIKALTFDTGGTVLDWHGGLVRAFERIGLRHGVRRDWAPLANDWRRRTMKGIVGQRLPAFHMDDVHWRTLAETLSAFELADWGDDDRKALWQTWHQLDAWPDFPAALAAIRQRWPVISFTMLPTSLVIDVSRRNQIDWDGIVSCEMIGIYKPHPEAYQTAARWLSLAPEQILMVACHNFDLNAAREVGFRTAFVKRPLEWGPEGPPDPTPNPACDIIVDRFDELRDRLFA